MTRGRPKGNVPDRLLVGCPDSGFKPGGLYAGRHCGCNSCCFCKRPHPLPSPPKVARAARPRAKEVAGGW